LEDLAHTIQVFDANGVEKHRVDDLRYGETSSFSVTPGLYTFKVEAFYYGDLVATGSTERTIHSGANSAVIIQMGTLPKLEGTVIIVDNEGVAITEPVFTGTKLTAVYSGTESGVSFQWKKDQAVIPGATGATYTLTTAGSYTVTVSLAGYNSKTSDPVSVIPILSSINDINNYLATQTKGGDVNNLVYLPVSMELSSANWENILNAISNSGKYVELNLSGCTRSANVTDKNTLGGLELDGTLSLCDSYNTAMIVSLILPEDADIYLPNIFGITLTFLRYLDTGNGLTTIAFGAFLNNQLTSVIIGNSVEEIGDTAFSGNLLTTIVIPDSVKTIQASAFKNNQLTSITIGANVTFDYTDGSTFDGNFGNYYEINGKQAGTYTLIASNWTGPY